MQRLMIAALAAVLLLAGLASTSTRVSAQSPTPTAPPLAACPTAVTMTAAPAAAGSSVVAVTLTPSILIKAAAAADPQSFHVHYYVDTDASALKPGDVIPAGNPAIVHSGDTNLNLNLPAGPHRVTVVLAQLNHAACGDATGKVVAATAALNVVAVAQVTPVAPKTGNAGLASGTSSMAVLGLLVAAAAVLGARRIAGRTR